VVTIKKNIMWWVLTVCAYNDLSTNWLECAVVEVHTATIMSVVQNVKKLKGKFLLGRLALSLVVSTFV